MKAIPQSKTSNEIFVAPEPKKGSSHRRLVSQKGLKSMIKTRGEINCLGMKVLSEILDESLRVSHGLESILNIAQRCCHVKMVKSMTADALVEKIMDCFFCNQTLLYSGLYLFPI
jgi:hypothetical protein